MAEQEFKSTFVADTEGFTNPILNAAQAMGFIKFGEPLAEDGIFGNKTFAATVILQNKLGLRITGAVTDLEYKALNLLMEGKLP